tara:strand:+ start:115 stop:2631 length:2517 start_codon:yes stop_codon:yes gene_type:complete
MWVRTGSADELPGEEGISHFIEHLVFKGSESFKVGEIAATVEASGGQINAYTSFDQTVFYVTLSKQFEDTGLKVISEMMGSPLFDEEEIDREREVVVEEIKRGQDSLNRQASRLLFSTLYKGHPYEKPVIGYEKNVREFSQQQIQDYFKGRYNPKNMFLLVVGDFNSKEMKEKIKEHFGKFKENPLRKTKRSKWSFDDHKKLVVKEGKFKETLVYLTWPLPKASHKDMQALEVLALILGQGESSRLHKYLRLQKASVLGSGAGVFSAKDSGFMALTSSLKGEKQEEFFKDMIEALTEFVDNPPTQEELDKAKVNFFSEQFYSMETVDGLARKYGHYEDLFEDPDHFEEILETIKTMELKDLMKVFRKYLKPEKLKIISMTEEGCSEKVKVSARKFVKSYVKVFDRKSPSLKGLKKGKFKAFRMPASKNVLKETDYFEQVKLNGGAQLIYRPSFDTPVVSLRAGHLGGARFESEGSFGAAELLSRVWMSGSDQLSEDEINAKMESLASSVSSFAGRHTIGMSLTTLTSFFDPSLELFSDLLRKPSFPENVLQREVQSMKDQIAMRSDHPAQYCMLQFMQEMFKDHPYGRDPFGGEKSLEHLGQKEVREIWKKSLGPKGLVISCSGAIEKNKLVESLNGMIENWKDESVPFPRIPFNGLSESRKIVKDFEKEQTHIVLGYPGLDLKDEDRYALNIIQAVLAGQGGRLFVELRDKASLAYSVSPLRMEALEGGYFGAYIGCTPSKTNKAIEMMRNEFDRISSTKISTAELERAKRYLMGRHDIDLQRNASLSSSLMFDQLYGTNPTETFEFAKHIEPIGLDEVLKVSQRIFGQQHVLSIVS